jgi:hypothetical protein
MAITYTWTIGQLISAPTENNLTNVVKTAHWNLTATETVDDKTYTTSSYGSVGLSQPNPQDFIPYFDLESPEVVGWVKEAIGQERVTTMELALANGIELQKNPKTVVLPLPWV